MEAVETRLRELERQVDAELERTEPDPHEEARHLADLEAHVLGATAEAADGPAGSAGDAGQAVLGQCAAWRDLARDLGAKAAAARADALAGRLITDRARDWSRRAFDGAGPADPRACFRTLADARQLDLEALALGRPDTPLAAERARLREALRDAVRRDPPPPEVRDRWTTELRDRADVVLTSIDEAEPDRASRMLDLVGGELEWHAHEIESGARRATLRRRARRLRAERQERNLQHRLELRFGARSVARFERVILWLIVFVLALLTVEMVAGVQPTPEEVAAGAAPAEAGGLSHETVAWFILLDSLACLVFLTEIVIKLRYVRGRWSWAARHFVVDILPSIPFALLVIVAAGVFPGLFPAASMGREAASNAPRAFRLFRFFRLGRLGRYVRVLRPVIRLARAVGFLLRGTDRLARRYGHLLNRNIVLYPTREERRAMSARRDGSATRLRRLLARVNGRWERLLTAAPPGRREEVAGARVDALERLRARGGLPRYVPPRAAPVAATGHDMSAEDALHHLASVAPEEIEAELGADLAARLARAARLLGHLRWVPFLRGYAPRVGRGMSDRAVLAAAARRIAGRLRRHLGRWLWFADLYGTITPAQFVDRVGMTMVKASFRPAYRLALFGLVYLFVNWFLDLSDRSFLRKLDQLVSDFLVVFGSICFGVLGIGWWLRRIAGQATDFFERAAGAQYLALTESIKGRTLDRDAGILDRRVLAPERALYGRDDAAAEQARFVEEVKKWLLEAQPGERDGAGFLARERVTLLYRDWLDGALLADSDTRTTTQLLGNPAVRNLRLKARRITPRENRQLDRLDLERQKSLFGGPYFWFSLLCQSIQHGVARLIVDYNRHALTLAQLANASEDEQKEFRDWLDAEVVAPVQPRHVFYVTTHFTALHFLDDDPRRDREVERRFGTEVLSRLKRDRRLLFRRTFGTYPLHRLRREDRVLNLYRTYQRLFEGGRALLLILRPLLAAARFARRFARWLVRCIGEVRSPTFSVDRDAAESADYFAALRKIRRMRGPAAEAALRVRARFDPAYLGVPLPGGDPAPGTGRSGLDDDLAFLGAGPELVREMEHERERAARDMARLNRAMHGGLLERVAGRLGTQAAALGPEHLRAAACACLADVGQVRRLLFARTILREVYTRAARSELRPAPLLPNVAMRLRFRRYWKRHGSAGPADRDAAWRATVHNVEGAADALCAWDRLGDGAGAEGETVLAGILRHPERITEQLVTVRAVQTLSLIDVLNYRDHVYRLGAYAESGDPPDMGRSLLAGESGQAGAPTTA